MAVLIGGKARRGRPTKVADVSALSGDRPATHNHRNNQDGLRPPLMRRRA
jgi:hypothetical protein